MDKRRAFEQDFLDDYSDAALIQELHRVAGLLAPGARLTVAAFDKASRVHSGTIRRRFRIAWGDITWGDILRKVGLGDRCHSRSQKAVTAAAVKPSRAAAIKPPSDERITEQECIDRLRAVAASLGTRRLSTRQFRKHCKRPTVATIRRLFGTWDNFLRAAGLEPGGRSRVPYSKDQCLQNLLKIYRATGAQPTYKSLSMPPSSIGPKAYERLWGTFSCALREFGQWMAQQDPRFVLRASSRTRILSEADLIRELQRVAAIAGTKHVAQSDVLKYSSIDPRTFAARLGGGSWERTSERAHLELSPHAHRRHTDEEYFENLMKVWESLGRRPRCKEMSRHPLSTLTGEAYCNRFGTWRKGLRAFLQWVESTPTEEASDPSAEKAERALQRPIIEKDADVDRQEMAANQGNAPVRPGRRHPTLADDKPVKGRNPTSRQRILVFGRDNFMCVYCGRARRDGVGLTVDHKVPWSRGGETRLSNLQTLCRDCNIGKSDLPIGDAQ